MLTQFVESYVQCMLWADEPEDECWDINDISGELRATIETDCAEFLSLSSELIESEPFTANPGPFPTSVHKSNGAGHDFWLTRQGHGAGFWDGDWPQNGDRLTAICKEFPHVDIYMGDDGKLYA